MNHTVESASAPVKAGKSIMRDTTILDVQKLHVDFPISRSIPDVIMRRPQRMVKAVNRVDLSIPSDHIFGLVGESGSGKTTLARTIVGLVERTNGEIRMAGKLLPPGVSDRDSDALRQIQLSFQNPEGALNPY